MSEEPAAASPSGHWKRRRSNSVPIPRDQAARQGAISQLAFLLLGRERAIEFLNTDHPTLGGRPLALATESDEGRAAVEAELGRMAYDAPRDADVPHAVGSAQ
jgi:uncharacterized protein (DUF2384 family)